MRFSAKHLYVFLTFCLLIGRTSEASAQLIPGLSGKNDTTPTSEVPDDSLGRRDPRGTVSGFIHSVAEQNFIRASQYLNLEKGHRSDKERQRIVKVLQRLLDQGGNVMPYSWLSNKTEGRIDDELPLEQDLVGTVTANGKVINLYVETTGTPEAPIWKISKETVEAIAAITSDDELLVDRVLPKYLKDNLWGGVAIGHWLAVVVLFVLAYLVSWIVTWFISFILRLSWPKARTEEGLGVIQAFTLPIKLYLAVWLFVAVSQQVGISIIVRQRFSTVTLVIGLVAFVILLLRLTDQISSFSKGRMTQRGRVSAVSIILFLRRAIKIAVIIFGIVAILSTIGFDVTAGIAALGIGGIALALGAQKTVENFVGSVTLIADQPVRVGDFCKVGDTTGTVEQIGMRSTKIRTGERTVITIPNGEFSSTKIENYAHRDRFLFAPVIDLRYETTPDQIRYLLVELRSILYAHPMVSPDPARVRFAGFGQSSLKLEVWSYVIAPDFDLFLEVKEDLLLRMMDVIAASGSDFAFPSQTLYFAKDKGLPEDKSREAAERVKVWKENNELQIPAFHPEKIESIKNTISYPPEGSVLNKPKDENDLPD
ncbi:MAG: mechanosensitive ion channel family protein [Pedobacter sp.]